MVIVMQLLLWKEDALVKMLHTIHMAGIVVNK